MQQQYNGYPQQGWQGQASGYQPYAEVYDPVAAAASSVLGVPPPPPPGYQYNGSPGPSYAPSARSTSYASSVYSMTSAHSAPSVNGGQYYGPPVGQPGPPPDPYMEEEIASRPPLQRSGTTASFNLRTQKSKAIDLSAPPYTKEYIDQYRQRIKADPDPEAHFAYAKYLIDAAKHIGADAKDQRAVKKYRDLLIQEALKVMRRLATQGQPYDEAQFFLANCYGTGMLGLQVDHEKAYHLYLQAAKQNHPASCYRVAVCNEIGAGTRREPPRAIAFYRKAASLGDTAAMYKLGMILLNGSLGEQKNPREAIGWLRRAAEQADEENPHALHELALLHEMPNSGLVPHDPYYAKKLLTQAGQLGYTQSQYKLGQCYEYGTLTCPVDPRRSIAWYTKAAEKGNAEAELALSGWYLTGVEGILKQSDSEAYLWARRAANKGLAKAEYAVGYYAEQGIGIKQDIEFAKRWYMRAAAQGNKRAMARLTEMKRGGARRAQNRPTRQDAKDECVIM
ncbi:HCP-like protein [Punctularia strigosozonata HHB-11173 SS5]|uniref:HCP-like protein n=1 Tax=Punctularia strigosozonata (strain HHB-11173) TaxID=741275 RepID=UPI0004416538|nr:HCP-like protein [Punctularia strigosozonata HHB-11173 SS5]EIN07625.1 HCP-like protein [Punctularia strigosozonata HHB-11173 SS5]